VRKGAKKKGEIEMGWKVTLNINFLIGTCLIAVGIYHLWGCWAMLLSIGICFVCQRI